MFEKSKPITPYEVEQSISIPSCIIESVNYLLKQSNKRITETITIYQEDLINEILSRTNTGINSRDDIFKNNYLNIEKLYEQAGWKVTYDKPGYNESGRAYFEFKAKL